MKVKVKFKVTEHKETNMKEPISLWSATLRCSRISASSTLIQGCALIIKKQRSNFTRDQTAYFVEKYNIGKRTGRKEDPFEVAEEMRSEMKSGVRRFSKSEFISG